LKSGRTPFRDLLDRTPAAYVVSLGTLLLTWLAWYYVDGSERGVSAQESSTQITEVFFNQAINNLRAQAKENRQAIQQLTEQ
jgi:hypothetical protein